MPNSFGHIFRVTTFGESHGPALGAVIDGCPAGVQISLDRIQAALDRRRPGQSEWTTQRKESDTVECVSGLQDGFTLGTPITLLIRNHDARPKDYSDIASVFRPSHADFSWHSKYGQLAQSGGGRASARETVARVAAAAIAEQVLEHLCPQLRVVAYVSSIKDLDAQVPEDQMMTRDRVDSNPFRCPDPILLPRIEALLRDTMASGDSVGGTIRAFVYACPAGLGEPVFDKLHADLAKAMLSLPAVRGFEVGAGFASCRLLGSENNDAFVSDAGNIRTSTNRSGGIQGGISNGETIHFRVAFKAPSTIFKTQQTVSREGVNVNFRPKQGRHDPCVLARAVPIVEAMTLLVLVDHLLRQQVVRFA